MRISRTVGHEGEVPSGYSTKKTSEFRRSALKTVTCEDKDMAKKLEPVTPGEILLEEFMKPMNITQAQLARDINVPPNRISQIIRGKREITADTALRLGKYFGIEPEFWLNLQVRYNMKVAKDNLEKKIEKEVSPCLYRDQVSGLATA